MAFSADFCVFFFRLEIMIEILLVSLGFNLNEVYEANDFVFQQS